MSKCMNAPQTLFICYTGDRGELIRMLKEFRYEKVKCTGKHDPEFRKIFECGI